MAQAEREGLSHLEFLRRVISGQAGQRRERSIARRIREAKFRELKTLATFDWLFNAKAIDRSRFEALATGEFIRRRENLMMIGRSGVGKSHLVQAIGLEACVLGWRVRYTTSAQLLDDLRACLADRTLSAQVRYYAKFDLLIIDEFGFDRIERQESPEATHALFKVVDARNTQRSTALVTNVDHKAWEDYLGDPALAMGLTDRLVERANIVRIEGGRSYRDEMRKPQS